MRSSDSQSDSRRSKVPSGYEHLAGDPQFATTLARGIELLRCFKPERPHLANQDLCQMLGLPKGTVSRLTYTLCQLGHLYQLPGSRLYALGTGVVAISYPLLANIELRQLARPLMDEFADSIRGSVSIAVRDRLNMVFVETSRSRQALSAKLADIGLSYPIGASATGRAYLASCSHEARQAILNEMQINDRAQWAQWSEALVASLKDFEQYGFCVNYGEMRPEIVAIGVPFPGQVNELKLVFNCAIHKFRISREQTYAEIGPRLVSLVQSLARHANP